VRVFLDANILFSAAKTAGAVRDLLSRLEAGGHVLCADAYVIEEARRNLIAKGPEAVATLEAMLARVEVAALQSGALPARVAALVHEKDRPVVAAAARLRCDVLLSGDGTHFGALYGERVMGVVVHSPRSLAEWLRL
jgi:predicted nucleic acid-binding protein